MTNYFLGVSLGDTVMSIQDNNIRGRVTHIDPDANKWPFTVERFDGRGDELFSLQEIHIVIPDTENISRTSTYKTINDRIIELEKELKALKLARTILEIDKGDTDE